MQIRDQEAEMSQALQGIRVIDMTRAFDRRLVDVSEG
jgi:hypothetical protein